MKERESRKLQGHFDRSLRFQYYCSVPHNERKHYWGVPNTNFGYYTSQQLQRMAQQRNRSTEPRKKYQNWRRNTQGTFIVENQGKGYIHCCTCHNNPKRYLSGQERCNYCQEHQKNSSQAQLTRNSLLSALTNPEAESQTLPKQYITVADKQIQVSLKLPSILKHRSKKYSSCNACKQKLAKLQACMTRNKTQANEQKQQLYKRREAKSRYLNPLTKNGRVEDSLIYSFSDKKKRA